MRNETCRPYFLNYETTNGVILVIHRQSTLRGPHVLLVVAK